MHNPSGENAQERYSGDEKIVFAFDIGTTQSAVAYTHLYPGSIPQARAVNKWPGQEEAAGDSKIPTLVAYQDGRPIAYGAEADEADVDGVELARWFKLHLHPESMKRSPEPPRYGSTSNTSPQLEIPPLPSSVSLKQVYAHFMRYLFNHARLFFLDNTVDGERIWSRLGSSVVIVLVTPNGWDTPQQAFLRESAILAGLVPRNVDDSRLLFVTEGEASVHFALAKSNGHNWLRQDIVFAVCDAGGSTVDSTLYTCKATTPKLVLEELFASECVQAGAVFIDRAGETILRRKLKNSKFAQDMYIRDMVQEFEKKTKRKFDGTQSSNIIKFGRDFENDRTVGVIKGRVTLQKEEVIEAFNASVPRIITSTTRLMKGTTRPVKHLLLVGGMGESPYLRQKLREQFSPNGVNIVTVDDSTKKAAAEGAAIWFVKQLVVARAARSTFGALVARIYNPNSSIHAARKHKVFIDDDGEETLNGFWDTWVRKNQVVGEDMRTTFEYYRTYSSITNQLGTFSVEVYAYDGEGTIQWGRQENGQLAPFVRHVCSLRADLSALSGSLKQQRSARGHLYWRIDYTIAILFGGTSLKARLVWKENGVIWEGPVSIIPNSIM